MTALLIGADLFFGVDAELVEDQGLDDFGRVLLAFQHLVIGALADVAFRALGHVFGFGNDGLQRLLAHHHLVALEEHDAGGEEVALGIDHRHRPAAFVDPRQHGKRGAQVDADGGKGRLRHLAHSRFSALRSVGGCGAETKRTSPVVSRRGGVGLDVFGPGGLVCRGLHLLQIRQAQSVQRLVDHRLELVRDRCRRRRSAVSVGPLRRVTCSRPAPTPAWCSGPCRVPWPEPSAGR